ncbi:VOC family protein [Aquibacillus sp. 3ASR75-11]|uniref:VOC family protein n=1 Tax=Terrihalobacillus insolitus TaxID=2950438 RepID=A0A9X3WT30_9BACI|nr:VOC family protein [Terrihalobacillus insolitus]MDC3414053.1 VOC family protein [Terrihalobacillus insolitus]MDC3424143.1 VOC family protein [Terrihalobacillus insolitus]
MEFHRHPHTYVGLVHLIVADLDRSLTFYKELIGLQVLEQSEHKVVLTADGFTPLLIIERPENVLDKQRQTTGLYHYALLLPNRSDLGSVLRHFIQNGYPLQGASDHLVSEAIYLADPDGNGIEIYIDRPSNTWSWENGEVIMTTDPLDAEGLLAEGEGKMWEGLPKDTVMGHIHLHVAELDEIKEFYTAGLGFDIANSMYGDQVLFVSTGNYHHHIGLNTWNGVGAPQQPENSVGLRSFSIVLPSEEERKRTIEQLRQIGATISQENETILTQDPSGNWIKLCI